MAKKRKIEVLIVDDHASAKEGLRLLLSRYADVEVVSEATDGAHAVEELKRTRPDVVLMDISTPSMGGLEATRLIQERWPDIRVIALTIHDDSEHLFQALHSGVAGYVLKGTAAAELVHAVRAAHGGGMYIDPKVARYLARRFVLTPGADGAKTPPLRPLRLSKREWEVLTHVAEGRTSREIGGILRISENTVQTYCFRIKAKLGLKMGRGELMGYAFRLGLMRDRPNR